MTPDSILFSQLCARIGIKYPIFQAGMGFVAHAELAAAVSNAGGLGCIGSGTMRAAELREQIRRCRDLTDKPFGVDILFAEIKADKSDDTVVRYSSNVEKLIEITFEEGVPVIVSGLGNPAGIVPRAHQAGVVVMSLCGNVRQARRLEASGIDVIIAQGHEAGGHTGRVGTMALVPEVVDAVRVPVLAAGGIADGRGLVAALALGAQGVWMGSRFVASTEAFAHANYKNKIVEIDEEGTIITRCHSGKPCRLVRNRFTDSWVGRESEIMPFPLQSTKIGFPLAEKARYEGKIDDGGLACGQGAGLIHAVKPAGRIVSDVMDEARSVIEARFLGGAQASTANARA